MDNLRNQLLNEVNSTIKLSFNDIESRINECIIDLELVENVSDIVKIIRKLEGLSEDLCGR